MDREFGHSFIHSFSWTLSLTGMLNAATAEEEAEERDGYGEVTDDGGG